jgi:hypothetical protein
MAGGKKDGKLVNPNSCCLSTAAIAGERRDQKLAAIITPPVKPRAASRSFLLADLKKNTRLAPSAVKIHVNNPPTKACKIGLSNEIKKSSKAFTSCSILNNPTKIAKVKKKLYEKGYIFVSLIIILFKCIQKN